MATSEGHNLDQQINPSFPVSTQLVPIFSPSLEYHGPNQSPPVRPPVRPLAPRKGSPRRDNHVPRPRNSFMIFRSEYYGQSKITGRVERDHRHISRIFGHIWNALSEEEKAPYRRRADNEKLEHQRKYPGYRFSPGSRISKPIKRNVKRNGKRDLARSQKVAELLQAGIQGRELELALKDINFESSSTSSATSESSSRSSFPATVTPPSLPNVRGMEVAKRTPDPGLSVFRSPLLAPQSDNPTVPHSQGPKSPIMDSSSPEPSVVVSGCDSRSLNHLAPTPAVPFPPSPNQNQMLTLATGQTHMSYFPPSAHHISHFDQPNPAQYQLGTLGHFDGAPIQITPSLVGLQFTSALIDMNAHLSPQHYRNQAWFVDTQEHILPGLSNEQFAAPMMSPSSPNADHDPANPVNQFNLMDYINFPQS
ncbi:hypothetical protein GYMLUDRAFT_32347 [Collybiopsis luxurians FD-317 M1]|nr:hypothetical protein GYMLUDRAFT_32347 [Collybiopsis luxurians FD-317 M1]